MSKKRWRYIRAYLNDIFIFGVVFFLVIVPVVIIEFFDMLSGKERNWNDDWVPETKLGKIRYAIFGWVSPLIIYLMKV